MSLFSVVAVAYRFYMTAKSNKASLQLIPFKRQEGGSSALPMMSFETYVSLAEVDEDTLFLTDSRIFNILRNKKLWIASERIDA